MASLRHLSNSRQCTKCKAALRWVPWLCTHCDANVPDYFATHGMPMPTSAWHPTHQPTRHDAAAATAVGAGAGVVAGLIDTSFFPYVLARGGSRLVSTLS